MTLTFLNLSPSSSSFRIPSITLIPVLFNEDQQKLSFHFRRLSGSIRCTTTSDGSRTLRTCKNCKTQFDPLLNHPRACRFHAAHFGGETKRKFESVYSGGTMDTPDSGKVFQYWHCCGCEDPLDPGCTAAPHASYDD